MEFDWIMWKNNNLKANTGWPKIMYHVWPLIFWYNFWPPGKSKTKMKVKLESFCFYWVKSCLDSKSFWTGPTFSVLGSPWVSFSLETSTLEFEAKSTNTILLIRLIMTCVFVWILNFVDNVVFAVFALYFGHSETLGLGNFNEFRDPWEFSMICGLKNSP